MAPRWTSCSNASRSSQRRVVFETVNLRRLSLWTIRRTTERVLGANGVGGNSC
jgi:hypothetical protein